VKIWFVAELSKLTIVQPSPPLKQGERERETLSPILFDGRGSCTQAIESDSINAKQTERSKTAHKNAYHLPLKRKPDF